MLGASRLTSFAAAGLAAGLLAFLLGPHAKAGEAVYCVTCSKPDQTYLCRVTGEGSSHNDALKLYCIVRIAKEENHASCSATGKVEGCNGVIKAYSYNGPSLPAEIAQDPRVKKLMGRVAHDRAAFAKPQSNEPKTLVELTGRAMSASRQRWRNTFGGTEEPQQSPVPGPETAAPSPAQSQAPLVAAHSPAPPVQTASLPPASAGTRSTGQRVKQAAQSAGAAVGSAARTTYWCLRSFFFNCSGE